MNLARLLLSSSRRAAVLALAAGLVGGAGGVGLVALIQAALTREDPRAGWLVGGFGGLCLAVLVTRAASQVLLIRLAQDVVYRLYTRMSRQMLAVPLRQFETIGPHRLLAALTEDVPATAGALVGMPIVCVNGAILLCCLIYLGWLSPPLLLGVSAFLAAGVLSYRFLVCRALSHLRGARQEHDALMSHFRGLTDGVKELQMHRGRRDEFLDRFLGQTAARLRDRTTSGMAIYAVAGTWGELLFLVCIGLLLFAGPGGDPAARGVVSGYVLTILYAAAPLEAIMTWLPVLGRARVALRSVEDLNLSLATPPGPRDNGRDGPPPLHFGHVELAGVTHSYGHGRTNGDGGDDFALGPIDLILRRGEVVFVAGGNGGGKTTLAKLLVGLYAPASGSVRLNGRPVGERDRGHYRELFSALFSDGHLFEQLLGSDGPRSDARARHYLRRLELGKKVHIEGGRFSTIDLSHGQRQRLALLTAYLEDRPVYVFDEWASHQDPRFKEVFYTHLLPELKARGKAVLVISHDDRYFHVADRVVRLDYGTLDEVIPNHEPVRCC